MNRLIALVLSLLILSCEKEVDIKIKQWPVVKVEGPSTAELNKSVILQVYWPYSNGCDILDKFIVESTGSTTVVKAFGYTQNAICTQEVGIKIKTFLFTPRTKGVSLIKFINPDGSSINYSIDVQ